MTTSPDATVPIELAALGSTDPVGRPALPTSLTSPTAPAGPPAPLPWRVVARPDATDVVEKPLRTRRLVAQLVAGVVLVLALVGVGGSFGAQRLAEREAVNDAASMADLLAEAVIQPALTDGLAAGDAAGRAALDSVVRAHVLRANVTRVKVWSPSGTILYSDEARLIGQRFDLGDDEREVLANPRTEAQVSDLSNPENAFESGDRLLEVYRPVWTPDGSELLFEMYSPYDSVLQRSGQLWRGFAGITLSSLLLLLVLLTPVLWRLLSRVRRAATARERLLEQAVDASAAERRRIAATLHDGPVQELAATSFAVSATAERADAVGQAALGSELRDLSGTVRSSIRALRSLLVDIYPPSLTDAGLATALADLGQTARSRGVDLDQHVDPADDLGLTPEQERLVHRVTQEILRNVVKHAAPCRATLTLQRVAGDVVLEIADEGTGFDAGTFLDAPRADHFGLRILTDLAARGGGLLQLATAPGDGTRWRLTIPRGKAARP